MHFLPTVQNAIKVVNLPAKGTWAAGILAITCPPTCRGMSTRESRLGAGMVLSTECKGIETTINK